ncbi:MAG: hypothetical protein AB7U30_05815 [Sulfuricellaceae bacterium]|jgi:hypothetical protein
MIVAVTYLALILIAIGIAAAMIFSGPKETREEEPDDSDKS